MEFAVARNLSYHIIVCELANITVYLCVYVGEALICFVCWLVARA